MLATNHKSKFSDYVYYNVANSTCIMSQSCAEHITKQVLISFIKKCNGGVKVVSELFHGDIALVPITKTTAIELLQAYDAIDELQYTIALQDGVETVILG